MLGLFSSLMREQAHIFHTGPKWIVLDGDIDPMWTESLNTVMDDNKVPPSCSLMKPISTWGRIGGQMVYFWILQELLLECDLWDIFAVKKKSFTVTLYLTYSKTTFCVCVYVCVVCLCV